MPNPRLTFRAQNFRRLTQVDVPVTRPVCVIAGPNRAGKTSFVGGIVTTLVGKHPEWFRRTGESLADLCRDGANQAELEVTFGGATLEALDPGGVMFGGAFRVSRTLARSQKLEVAWGDPLTVGPTAGKIAVAEAQIQGAFGVTADQLAAVLSATAFLDMPAKEQTGFLAALVGEELTEPDLREALAADDAGADALLPAVPWSEATGAALLDEYLALATERRRDRKKDLTEAQGRKADAEAALPPRPEGERPEDAEAEHTRLCQELLDGREAAGKREGIEHSLTRAREAKVAMATIFATETEALAAGPSEEAIAEAKAELDAVSEARAAAQETQDEAFPAAVEAKDAREQAARLHEAASRRLTVARQAFTAAEATLPEALAQIERFCPTCAQPVPAEKVAQLQRLRRGEIMGPVVSEKDAAFEALADAPTEAEVKQAEKAYTDAVLAVGDAKKAVADAHTGEASVTLEKLRDAREPLERTVERTQATLARIEQEIATYEKDLAALPEPDVDLAGQVEAAGGWADWAEADRAAREARKTTAALGTEVAAWERLVKAFGDDPGGYRAALVGDRMEEFVGAVNEVLVRLTGGEVNPPAGKTPLAVRLYLESGALRALPATPGALSGSESLALKIALQYAFCRVLNVPLLLVDAEAALDAETREAVFDLFQRLTGEWPELTIVAATVEGPEAELLREQARLQAELKGAVGEDALRLVDQINAVDEKLVALRAWCQTVTLREGAVEEEA